LEKKIRDTIIPFIKKWRRLYVDTIEFVTSFFKLFGKQIRDIAPRL